MTSEPTTKSKMKEHHKKAQTLISGGWQDEHEAKFLSKFVGGLYGNYKKVEQLQKENDQVREDLRIEKTRVHTHPCVDLYNKGFFNTVDYDCVCGGEGYKTTREAALYLLAVQELEDIEVTAHKHIDTVIEEKAIKAIKAIAALEPKS